MSSPLIPTFSYKVSVEGSYVELKNIQNRFLKQGCHLIAESDSSFKLKASSNDFQLAMHPFSKDLLIEGNVENQKIELKVTRASERNFSFYFLGFVCLIAIASFVQNREVKMLMFPLFTVVAIYFYSVLPTHPAHNKIRKLLYNPDEP